jgi:hypothetical protein
MKTRIVLTFLATGLLLAFIGASALIAQQAPATPQAKSPGMCCDSTGVKACCQGQHSSQGCCAAGDKTKCVCPNKGQCTPGANCAGKAEASKNKAACCPAAKCPKK